MKNWAFYIAAALGFTVYGAVTDADRDSSGAIVAEGNVDAFNVHIGDCFNDYSESYTNQVTSVPGVPCSDPHDNEAFAVFDVTIPSYPESEDAMAEIAHNSCVQRFDSFVGRDYASSSLDIITLYPTSQSWKRDDREVVCAVYDMEENKLVGSIQGQGL